MDLKRTAFKCIVVIFFFMVFTAEYIGAGEQESIKDAESVNMPLGEYRERFAEEKTILKGLKKLLEVKEHEALIEEEMKPQSIAENDNLSISKKTGKYGTVLYSLRAELVPIKEIMQALVSVSGKKIIIDEDIPEEELSSVVSLFLEDIPLADIIDIILGAKGFEAIISEELIFATLPAKLNVVSSYDYFQEKAVQAYQKAMIKYPKYNGISKAYYELGKFYLTSKFPSIALQEFREVTKNYPENPLAKESLFNEGRCYEMLDDIENAKKSYLSYVRKYTQASDVDDTYLIIGDLWRKQNNYEKAIGIYQHIIKEYYDRESIMYAYMRLGNTYLDAGEYSSALHTYLTMKKKFLPEAEKSGLYKHPPDNTHSVQKTVPPSPGELERYDRNSLLPDRFYLPEGLRHELAYQLGNCYYLLGKYDEAIMILKDFVFHEENNVMLDKAYYKLADCFFKIEDYMTAFHLYQSALAEYPGSSLSSHGFLYSGKSLHYLKMIDNAIETLHKGISKYHDSIYAENMKFEIGLCYLDDENFKRALDMFEEIAREGRGKDLAVKANIYAGICLARDKRFEKAIEYYRKALREDTSEKRVNLVTKLIGDSYNKSGLYAEAVKAYQKQI